jgi:hypothetical protein
MGRDYRCAAAAVQFTPAPSVSKRGIASPPDTSKSAGVPKATANPLRVARTAIPRLVWRID